MTDRGDRERPLSRARLAEVTSSSSSSRRDRDRDGEHAKLTVSDLKTKKESPEERAERHRLRAVATLAMTKQPKVVQRAAIQEKAVERSAKKKEENRETPDEREARHKERDRARHKDKDKDKDKDKEREREREREREKGSDRDKDRDRRSRTKESRDKETPEERDIRRAARDRRDKDKDKDKDKHRDKKKSSSRDPGTDKSRDRDKDKDKDKDKDRRSRRDKDKDLPRLPAKEVRRESRGPVDSMRMLMEDSLAKLQRQAALLSPGRFASWERADLILLLVRNKIELRNERAMQDSTLRDIAEKLFEGAEYMPDKPKFLNWFELIVVGRAVAKIQDCFINKRFNAPPDDSAYNEGDEDEMEQKFEDDERLNDDIDDIEAGAGGANRNNPATRRMMMVRAEADHTYESVKQGGMGLSAIYDIKQQNLSNTNRNIDRLGHTMADSHKELSDTQRPVSLISTMLNTPWSGPDWDKAKIHADYYQPRRGGKGGRPFTFGDTTTGRHCCLSGIGEQCDPFREKQTSEFGIYGSGVSNYFKFVKWCIGVTLCLSLISSPLLMLNVFGPTDISEESQGLSASALSVFSIGNLMPKIHSNNIVDAASVEIKIPLCGQGKDFAYLGFDTSKEHDDCYLNSEDLGLYMQGIDLLMCAALCVAYLWLKYFEEQETLSLDKNTVFASMYTVQIKNLPEDANEASVAEYVQNAVGHTERTKVCAVNIAYDNLEELKDCNQRGESIREKMRITNQYRYKLTKLRESDQSMLADESKNKRLSSRVKAVQAEFYKEVMVLDAAIHAREHALANLSTRVEKPLVAFVTFNTVRGVEAAFEAFKEQSIYEWIRNGFKDETAKFRNKRLRVKIAPEPSTIMWENIPFGEYSCFVRRMLTNFAALLMISTSVSVTFLAKYWRDTSSAAKGRAGICPEGFLALAFSDQERLIIADTELTHCYCDTLDYLDRSDDPLCSDYFASTVKSILINIAATAVVLMVNVGLGDLLQKFARFEKHHTMDSRAVNIFQRLFILRYVNTSLVFLVSNNARVLSIFLSLGYEGTSTQEFSSAWYDTIGAQVMLVQIGNIVAGHAMKFLQWGLYHRRLYKAYHDPLYATTQGELNKIHEGPEFRFAENYAQYMSTFYVCMTFNLGMPLLNWVAFINFFMSYLIDKTYFTHIVSSPARLTSKLGRKVRSYVPWGIVLHICMSLWTLSSSSRFSAPHNAATSGNSITAIVLSPANYIIGSVSEKLFETNAYVLALVLFLLLVLRIVYNLGSSFKKSGMWIYVNYCRNSKTKAKAEDAANVKKKIQPTTSMSVLVHNVEVEPEHGILFTLMSKYNHRVAPQDSIARAVSYPRAVQRNLIKGLATFNILHNPVYKESFAISWKFAMSHRRVRSVHMGDSRGGKQARELEAATRAMAYIKDREIDEDARKVERLRRASALPALMMQSQGTVQLKTTKQQQKVNAQKARGSLRGMDLFQQQGGSGGNIDL